MLRLATVRSMPSLQSLRSGNGICGRRRKFSAVRSVRVVLSIGGNVFALR